MRFIVAPTEANAINFSVDLLLRAWAAITAIGHWFVESLPVVFYFVVTALVCAMMMAVPAFIIFRGADWLRKGGLRYRAIRTAQRRKNTR